VDTSVPAEGTLEVDTSVPAEGTLEVDTSVPAEGTLEVDTSVLVEGMLEVGRRVLVEGTLEVGRRVLVEGMLSLEVGSLGVAEDMLGEGMLVGAAVGIPAGELQALRPALWPEEWVVLAWASPRPQAAQGSDPVRSRRQEYVDESPR
jgi:hypothetical protein